MSDKSSLPFLGLTNELGQLLKVVPHLHEGVNGQEELRKGKLMHWNALSHDDMLPWLYLAKMSPFQLLVTLIHFAHKVVSVSLLGVLRPPGPHGPPPAATRSIACTTSFLRRSLPANLLQTLFASRNARSPSQRCPPQLSNADGLWLLC